MDSPRNRAKVTPSGPQAFHGSDYDKEDDFSPGILNVPSLISSRVTGLVSGWWNSAKGVGAQPSPDEVRQTSHYAKFYENLSVEFKKTEASLAALLNELQSLYRSKKSLIEKFLFNLKKSNLKELEDELNAFLARIKARKLAALKAYAGSKDYSELENQYWLEIKSFGSELGLCRHALTEADRQLADELKEKKNKITDLTTDLNQARLHLIGTFRDLKALASDGYYLDRKRAILELEESEKMVFSLKSSYEKISLQLHPVYSQETLEEQHEFTREFLSVKSVLRDITDYKESLAGKKILEVQAIKNMLMFLNNVLFSTSLIKTKWKANTFRLFCCGGVNVEGSYVPTGIAHIKLRLKDLDIMALSDSETFKHWQAIQVEVSQRLLQTRGRYSVTAACYKELKKLQETNKPLTDNDVKKFIRTQRGFLGEERQAPRVSI